MLSEVWEGSSAQPTEPFDSYGSLDWTALAWQGLQKDRVGQGQG